MKTKLASAAAAFLVGVASSATIKPPPCVGQECRPVVSCGTGRLPSCPDFNVPQPKVPRG